MALERVTALAFGGRLRDAERALPDAAGPPDEIAWIRAYLDAARGRFERAESRCRTLLEESSSRAARVRAAITLGSVMRQTARHPEAEGVDVLALRHAPSRSLRAHALIGLAADAVGMLDARTCGRRLARAARVVPRGDWRCRVRLDWVRTEQALLVGNAPSAIDSARAALARARRAGAMRHEAKSLLFLGAALRQHDEAESSRCLEQARRIARRIGAKPIADVARNILSSTRG